MKACAVRRIKAIAPAAPCAGGYSVRRCPGRFASPAPSDGDPFALALLGVLALLLFGVGLYFPAALAPADLYPTACSRRVRRLHGLSAGGHARLCSDCPRGTRAVATCLPSFRARLASASLGRYSDAHMALTSRLTRALHLTRRHTDRTQLAVTRIAVRTRLCWMSAQLHLRR